MISTGQAAKLCGVSNNTILKAARTGALPSLKTPRGNLYRKVDVVEWIDNRLKVDNETLREGHEDLTGRVFKYRTVVRFDGYKGGKTRNGKFYTRRWWCRCKCGREGSIEERFLDYPCYSCSAMDSGLKKYPDGKYISGIQFLHIRKGSERRRDRLGDFKITQEFVDNLFEEQGGLCAISGVPLICSARLPTRKRSRATMSLDRIDSSKGYIEGNVQWVHKFINSIKSDHKQEDLISWCHIISGYQRSKEKP